MSLDFDPYLEWLGIPASEQPPDHYRLLGVSRFESDARILRAAADQRLVYLRTFQLSPQTGLAECLLNRIAAAKICLLDPEKKAAYDAELQAALAAVPTAEPPFTPCVPPPVFKEPPPAPPPIQSQPPLPFGDSRAAPVSSIAARVRRGKHADKQRTARTLVLVAEIVLGGVFGLAAGCFLLSLAYPDHPVLVAVRGFFGAETPTPKLQTEPIQPAPPPAKPSDLPLRITKPRDEETLEELPAVKPSDPPPDTTKPRDDEMRGELPSVKLPDLPFVSVSLELPKEVTVDLGNGIKLEMSMISAGEFMMGSGEPANATARAFKRYYPKITAKWFQNEHPQHRVRIASSFYLGKYEVTVAQFRQFVNQTGYKTDAERDAKGGRGFSAAGRFEYGREYTWRNPGFSQSDEHPVVIVSWNDAVAFCAWLSRKKGRTYRLPTEAEWEYACRAGSKTRFCYGDDAEAIYRVGNVADATAKAKFPGLTWTIAARDRYVFTVLGGEFQANGFGLYDMHGNVWEWCSDWYANDYYQSSPEATPRGPTSGKERVARGGSWYCGPTHCQSQHRGWFVPSYCAGDVGFRVASTP